MFYVLQDGKSTGPLSEAELSEMVSSGSLSKADLIWTEGSEDWFPASNLPALWTSHPAAENAEQGPSQTTTTSVPAPKSDDKPSRSLMDWFSQSKVQRALRVGLVVASAVWMYFALQFYLRPKRSTAISSTRSEESDQVQIDPQVRRNTITAWHQFADEVRACRSQLASSREPLATLLDVAGSISNISTYKVDEDLVEFLQKFEAELRSSIAVVVKADRVISDPRSTPTSIRIARGDVGVARLRLGLIFDTELTFVSHTLRDRYGAQFEDPWSDTRKR